MGNGIRFPGHSLYGWAAREEALRDYMGLGALSENQKSKRSLETSQEARLE